MYSVATYTLVVLLTKRLLLNWTVVLSACISAAIIFLIEQTNRKCQMLCLSHQPKIVLNFYSGEQVQMDRSTLAHGWLLKGNIKKNTLNKYISEKKPFYVVNVEGQVNTVNHREG